MMMELDNLPDPFSHPLFSDSSSIMDVNNFSTTNSHRATPPLLLQHPNNINPMYPYNEPEAISSPQFVHQKPDSVEAMREMIFRMAALQPVQIDPESVKPPKRRNVKISKDPQSVAARHRRERISERIRILQRLVPGGTKMDTASMLDEAVHYMKFLKKQVESLEQAAAAGSRGFGPTTTINHHNYAFRACGDSAAHMVGSMELLK